MQSRFCRTPPCGGSRPIDQSDVPAGLQAHRLVAFKRSPRGAAAVYGPSVRDGSSAPGRAETKRAKLSRLLHEGPGPSVRRARLPNRGVRERLLCQGGCHAAPEGKESFCCGYSEGSMPDELAFDLSACAGSEVALGESRLQWQSSFSQLRLSENRRKHFSSSTTRHVACNVVVNAFQQYERLVNLATAKLERRCTILGLAHPPLRETARIHWRFTIGTC
jgi:hypothetical protein